MSTEPGLCFQPLAGLVVGLLLLLGRQHWQSVFVGLAAAGLWMRMPLAALTVHAIGHSILAVVGVTILQRLGSSFDPLARPVNILRLVALVAFPLGVAGALVQAACRILETGAFPSGQLILILWLANMVSIWIIVASLTSWQEWIRNWKAPSLVRMFEASLLFALLLSVCCLGFLRQQSVAISDFPFPVLGGPLLVWATFRFGKPAVALAVLMVVTLAVWGTGHGYGVFARETALGSAQVVFGFVATASLCAFLLVSLVEQRKSIEQALRISEKKVRQSEKKYRDLIEVTGTGYAILDEHGQVLDSNDEYVRLTGRASLDEVKGHHVAEWIAEHDRKGYAHELELCLQRRVTKGLEIDYVGLDGSVHPIEMHATAVDSPDGPIILSLCQGIGERKQIQEQLRTKQQEFELLAAASPSLVYRADLNGDGVYANDARWQEFTGRPAQSWRGKGWSDAIHPDDRSRIFQSWQQAVSAHQAWQEEFRFRHTDGHDIWVLSRALPMTDQDGEVNGFVGTCADITSRKAAEDALSHLNAQILQTTMDGYLLADTDGQLQDVNSAYCEMVGYSREQLLTMNIRQLECQLSDKQVEQRIVEMVRDGKARFETKHRRQDDREIDLDVSVTILTDSDAEPLVAAFVRDVTDRKEAERELRKSESRLAEAESIANIGCWEWNVQTDDLWWSSELYRIFGLQPDNFQPTFEAFMEFVIPEQRASIEEQLQAVLQRDEPYEIECDVRIADDSIRHLWERASVERDANGHPLRMIGTTQDITELKASEKLLWSLAEGTTQVGDEFYPNLIRNLATSLSVRYVFVCDHLDDPVTRVRTLAFWMDGRLTDNIEYDVAGTPCEVAVSGEMAFFATGIQGLFPEDTVLVDMDAESYCGIPLRDRKGKVLAHLAVLNDRPMEVNLCHNPVLEIYVARLAAEIERRRADQALRMSEARLKTVISAAPIVLTSIGMDGRIELFDGHSIPDELEPGALVGKDYFEVWSDHPSMKSMLRDAFSGQPSQVVKNELYGVVFETRCSPVVNSDGEVTSAITVCVDVTERERVEQERARLAAIVEQTSDIIGLANAHHEILYLNSAARRAAGLSDAEDVTQLKISDVHPSWSNKILFEEALPTAAASGDWHGEVAWSSREGDETLVSMLLHSHKSPEGDVELYSTICRDITELRKAEDTLRLRSAAMDAATDGIVICDALTVGNPVVYVNDASLRLSGYSREELLGRSLRVLQGPESSPEVSEEMRSAIRNGRHFQGVILNYRKDGETFWNQLRITPIRNEHGVLTHFIGIQTDITSQQEAALALRNSEATLRSITDGSPDYIIMTDLDGTIQFINRTVPELTVDEVLGTPVFNYVPDSYHQTIRDCYERVKNTGKSDDYEVEYLSKDGGEARWFEASVGPVFRDGEVAGFAVNSRDVTDQRHMRSQLLRAERLASLGTFAAGVAHEINNPISAALMAVETAVEVCDYPGGSDILNDCLSTIVSSVQRCYLIVHNVLRFARQETSEKTFADINETVRSAVETTRYFADRHHATIAVETGDLPEVKINVLEIEQLVVNLIRNAIQSGEAVRVSVRTEFEEATVRIQVADTGNGIPDDMVDQVFDPFFTARESGGTGLGLAIVHSIVEDHGGSINVDSEVGTGTTITVSFPVSSTGQIQRKPD